MATETTPLNGDQETQAKVRKLVVAISSRALFDLDASHGIFERQGKEAFCRYQVDHEDEVLPPGVAFGLVKKFLAINDILGQTRVEVILLSRNSADTGLRVFNSIQHHGLGIVRAAFTSGESPVSYTHLTLPTKA